MVVFQQGHTETDIDRINNYTEKLGGRIIYVGNVQEFIDFLNLRKKKKRLIKEMVLFCHGIINNASFHYAGDNEGDGLFGPKEIKKVYESIFDFDAKIITYACRAGISVSGDDLTGKDAGQDKSPAQQMANTWDVEVKAFEMRSLYDSVYGTGKEIKEAEEYESVIKKYQSDIEAYKKEKAKGNVHAKPPEKPKDYDVMKNRNTDVTVRESNKSKGNGPIAPNGSWHLPGTASDPLGLKRGLQNYKPVEWKS
ncbi:hypothetical protein J8V57_15120 [Xenorhabdus sp. PB61.4]|nr:hypothetical protein [Xenorhabdus sp. PB61.4]